MKAKVSRNSWKHLDKVANIGETYVMYKLATLGIRSQKMLVFNDYDLLASNGARIEVKASTLQKINDKRRERKYNREIWAFTNNIEKWKFNKGKISKTYARRDRECDFFVFVCLNNDLDIVKCYVVPKLVVGTRVVITVPRVSKIIKEGNIFDYDGKWDLIQNFTDKASNKTKSTEGIS